MIPPAAAEYSPPLLDQGTAKRGVSKKREPNTDSEEQRDRTRPANKKSRSAAAFDVDSLTMALHAACKKGNVEVVQCLLQARVDANAPADGNTPLTTVCDSDDTWRWYRNRLPSVAPVIAVLLGGKADVNAPNSNGTPPLCLACESGNLQIVDTLLQHGPAHGIELNPPAAAEFSLPLQSVMRLSDCPGQGVDSWLDTCRALLNANADPDFKDHQGETALMDACAAGNDKAAVLLLQMKADPAITNKGGITALAIAKGGRNRCDRAVYMMEKDMIGGDHRCAR